MKNKYLVYPLIFASIIPFLWLLKDSKFYTLGSVAGLVGSVLIFWQVTLGMRFIISKFSDDTVWFNKTHQTLGKYALALILFHPFLKGLSYAGSLWFAVTPDLSNPVGVYIFYGQIAFLLFLIVWGTSALLRGKMKYRPWLYIHYLVYPMVGFVLLHAKSIGTYMTSVPWILMYWNVLTLWFIFVVAYRLSKFAGIGNYKFELMEKHKIGEDIFIYKFKPLGKKIVPKTGQYCHLQIRPFSEAHPFTVMESDFKTGVLTFGIKAEGKFTRFLSTLEPGIKVSLDGPYGVFTLEGHDSDPKVVIAGGIGITPFVDLIRRFGNAQTYMFYANKFLNLAVGRGMFKEVLDGRYYDVLDKDDTEGENIIKGRLNSEILEGTIPSQVFSHADFFICGPKPFYNSYRKLLLSMNVPAGKIFYEEFGF